VFSWYSELASTERRTFWACFGGWALDAFDVQIYSFVMPALMLSWKIDKSHAGLLAISGMALCCIGVGGFARQ